MASIREQNSGSWRVQVRRKGRSVSEDFVRYEDAKRWAVDAERQIDRGETHSTSRIAKLKASGDLIGLHVAEMKQVGSSSASLTGLSSSIAESIGFAMVASSTATGFENEVARDQDPHWKPRRT